MRNFALIILAFAMTGCQFQKTPPNEEFNVLFIGNSLTYFYDMPQTLQRMLDETHPNIKIDQSTFPGMSLSAHLSNIITSQTENSVNTRKREEGETTATELKIAEKEWDMIILQTGTVSVLIPENRDFKVNKAIADIKKLASNPNCKFVLFNTWPSKNEYPKNYCYSSRTIHSSIQKEKSCSPMMESLEQEMQLINASYDLVATQNNLQKTDNGSKFYTVLTTYPEIELYEDPIHPNKYGSFLNACIFYEMLTNNKASDLNYVGDIVPKTAALLKTIAH